jgi:hypothetical protein
MQTQNNAPAQVCDYRLLRRCVPQDRESLESRFADGGLIAEGRAITVLRKK